MKRTAVAVAVAGLLFALAAENYHGVAVAPGGNDAWVVTIETTLVYHSGDFGQNWSPQVIPTVRDFFDVHFVDAQNGWTCGRIADIWHTADGGGSWTRQNLGGPKFATRIRFFDANHGWAAGGEAIILHTTDGGGEWVMDFFPNPPFPGDTVDFQGLALVDGSTGYLVAGRFPEGDTFARGQGFIARHTAGGATELLRRDAVYDFYDVAIAGPARVWVVGGDDRTMRGVVLHSTDAGATWQEQTLPTGARFLRSVCFLDENNGWACGRNGTVVHTSDGGANWTLQSTGVDTTLFDIEFADAQRGMIAGNSVVLYTTDGGATWVRGFGGVAEGRAGSPRAALAVERNPALGSVRFASTGSSRGAIRVYDAAGKAVAEVPAGVAIWDGRTSAGRKAGSGLYFARRGAEAARFVLVAQ